MAVLRGEEKPETEEYGVSSFVFRAKKPFHPERLWNFIMSEGKKFLRVKGLFWVATRPDFTGLWGQAGQVVILECAGKWLAASPKENWPTDPEELALIEKDWTPEYGDRGQELVFIGQSLAKEEMIRKLQTCLISDQEDNAGVPLWKTFKDPLPEWKFVEDEQYLPN
jgi:G3E family GTPase